MTNPASSSASNPTSEQQSIYDVAIIGGGVCGTALLYCLSNYTNVGAIALIEKETDIALINSQKTSNSQTLHFGDIETNYTLEKAAQVNRAASLVKYYLLNNDPEQQAYSKYHKMVLAVGPDQSTKLRERYEAFEEVFPHLRIIDRAAIAQLEPNVLTGRPADEEVTALFTEEGYTIDFHQLSQSFLRRSLLNTSTPTPTPASNLAKGKIIDVFMDTQVTRITQQPGTGHYCITSRGKTIIAKAVAVTAGAHSLLFAKSMGYGQDLALLSVAGSFYLAPATLNGKVYTVQLKKLPFAAIHGDPEVHDPSQTRFGPTAKVLPLLERHNYATVYEYFKTAGLSPAAFLSFFKILSDWVVFKYILLNFIYDLPWIGKRLFIHKVRQIVPSIQLKDLTFAKGYGGVRPQIINLKTRQLEMGEAKILGDRILFNITPSPGASTCLQNAEDDTLRLMSFLGDNYQFDQDRFLTDLTEKIGDTGKLDTGKLNAGKLKDELKDKISV
ncbi:MAG: FAD-dependent oxidoreductase [Synechococcales cyanobacterium CRU_2_2]|nr:FAD-dependent oxidoreductase [Synechococcales cyanobacterium CRU_2_2]